MRLFHVSEEPDIKVFVPRCPTREDLDKSVGLVWAIDEMRLPNFLTPRDCPRVTYNVGAQTTQSDKRRFFSSPSMTHAVVLESRWLNTIKNTTLYLYEFETEDFVLQDDIAGYYVAKTTQYPKRKIEISDLFSELADRKVEIRIVDNLWAIADEVKESTLNWSLCRMANASPRYKV